MHFFMFMEIEIYENELRHAYDILSLHLSSHSFDYSEYSHI